jgi:hypothetical protein
MGSEDFSPGARRQEFEADHSTTSTAENKNCGVLFTTRLHGVVLNYLSTGKTLPFCLVTQVQH